MANFIPPGKSQFLDSDGRPLVGASVYHYIPGTSTPKDTYQDAGQTVLNTNPVILDAAGEAVIFGSGSYRQVLIAADGTTIWDEETQEPGASVGDSTVSGNLSVAGSTTAVDVSASGNVHVSGDFAADGLTSLGGTTNTRDLNCGGALTVFGTTTLSGDLGATSITASGDIGANNITAAGVLGANTISVSGTFSGTTSGWQLTPTGTSAFSGNFNLGIASGGGVLGTTFIAASDARIKVNVEDVPFADAYRFMRTMRAKVFMKDGAPDAGFIAQDAILNGFQRMVIVTTTDDPRMSHGDDVSPIGKRLNLNYTYATAYHHRMIDYLLDRIDDLQQQIDLLKN
jgi:hypothetical protein